MHGWVMVEDSFLEANNRRLGLARAILHNAPLILLDEPTEGLDADTEQQILALLQQHCQGKAVLMITHRLLG